jgi:hypothetical protein
LVSNLKLKGSGVMPQQPSSTKNLSLDTWAVLLALTVAIVIRVGLVTTVPW